MSAIRKKLIVVGDSNSDWVCLLMVYTKDEYPDLYVPQVFEPFLKYIEVDGKQVELTLTDGCNLEQFDRLRPLSFAHPDVILMCFSLSCPDSFNNIPKKWMPVLMNLCPNVPIILVGNNMDLRNDLDTLQNLKKMNQEPVRPEKGQAMANKIKAYAYLECSAKNNVGVVEVFETAARASLEKRGGGKEKKTCDLL